MNMRFCSSLLFIWLCLFAATPVFSAPVSSKQVILSAGVPIWVNATEAAPIQRAARDLSRDFEKVLGAASLITQDRNALGNGPFIEILGPNAGLEPNKDGQPAIAGHEAHAVFVKRDGRGTRIVLQGADMRGTIYAIYTFSEKFLGVKPLWFWASQPPLPQKSIVLADTTDLRFAPPSVRWRAWFPNDTDLFTPWKERSQSNYDALYEAMLRLKLNCLEGNIADESSLVPPYRLNREAETARDRGLAFVGHHVNPLGASYNLWDDFWRKIEHREPPALSVNNVEDLKTFWRWHIDLAQRNHLEEIWLIGFRAKGDQPFWTFFKDAPASDKDRAEVISRMMKVQVDLVKAATGEAAPVMRSTLYNELSDFYAAGLLRPPVEPNLIWTFVAARRDHYPAPDAQTAKPPANQPIGYYFNFQFTSSGAHLAQAEGPWKMERNFRFINGMSMNGTVPRPLEFSVVNMGNIREFILEGSADAAMMWNFDTYDSNKFLAAFCANYYGQENGPDVEALYRDFYAGYWTQRRPNLPGFERQFIFQDLRLNQTMRRLIDALKKSKASEAGLFSDGGLDKNGRLFNIVPADNGVSSDLDALIQGTGQSVEKLKGVVADADSLMPKLAPQQRAFFNDNLRLQARFLLGASEATHDLGLALRGRIRSDAATKEAVESHIVAAQTGAEQMLSAMAEAEHDDFKGWYDSDHIFGVKSLAKAIDGLVGTVAAP